MISHVLPWVFLAAFAWWGIWFIWEHLPKNVSRTSLKKALSFGGCPPRPPFWMPHEHHWHTKGGLLFDPVTGTKYCCVCDPEIHDN